jgi:3-oxoacyl-[acyl-carrier protein] reductase
MALGLADDGYELALVARGQQALEQLVRELPDTGVCVHSVHAVDVSDGVGIEAAMASILARHGRIDVLVNNAGAYTPGGLGLVAEEIDQMIRINLVAPFLFMRVVLPVMLEQGSGHVFNIASRAGLVGFAGDGGYVASKFGLVGLSASVYREYAAAGIGVTAICPGWTDTEMAAQSGTPLPPEEMIQPADIVATVRWILRLSPAARVREVMLECRQSIS